VIGIDQAKRAGELEEHGYRKIAVHGELVLYERDSLSLQIPPVPEGNDRATDALLEPAGMTAALESGVDHCCLAQ
jgi:hypothetical protein